MPERYDRRTVCKMAGIAGLTVGTTSLAGCSGNGGGATPTATPGETTVDMTGDLAFDPATVSIATGATVVWENVSSLGHSVTAYEDRIPSEAAYFASGGLDSEQAARDAYPESGDIAAGESYSHTFEVAGTYEYFCIPHEGAGMEGTVEVSDN